MERGHLQRKTYTAEIAKSARARPDQRRLRFTISTASTDRDRDQIDPRGWRLDSYRKNPVVLWSHDYRELPIARAVDIHVEGDRLVAEAEFPPADVYPFSGTVYELLKRGFLNATSVGFMPLKYSKNDARGGYDVTEADLLEFSIVPVPSNPEALVMARAANVPGLDRWAPKIFRQEDTMMTHQQLAGVARELRGALGQAPRGGRRLTLREHAEVAEVARFVAAQTADAVAAVFQAAEGRERRQALAFARQVIADELKRPEVTAAIDAMIEAKRGGRGDSPASGVVGRVFGPIGLDRARR